MDKMTKRDAFEMLINMVENSDNENKESLIEILEKQIASLDARAEKAREKAAEKAARSDEMREAIYKALTLEPKTAEDLVGDLVLLGFEDVTKNKVVARISPYVKAGEVEKARIEIEGRKVMAYGLPGTFETQDAE